jgi:hypothetical protein
MRSERWNDLYEEAVFELDPERLARKISEAKNAINVVLQTVDMQEGAERERLLNALKTLEKLSRFADPSLPAKRAA